MVAQLSSCTNVDSMQIAVQTMTTYADTLRLARWSEANGVASLGVADHYLFGVDRESPTVDQLVLLGGIARETETLELCTLVSPLTFRHPAVQLKSATALDQMSGGRFTLGVGTGWMEQEHEAFGLALYSLGERFDRLEENLAYLRASLDGSGTGFSGEYYKLEGGFTPQPRPQNLRIVVGGGGSRRTPDLAGRFADEFNVFPADEPMADRIGRARAAHADAGRDGELFVTMAFPPVAGSDRAEVEEGLRLISARTGRTTEQTKERYLALGIPIGERNAIAEGLAELESLGIQRVYLQSAVDIDQAIRQAELFLDAATNHRQAT